MNAIRDHHDPDRLMDWVHASDPVRDAAAEGWARSEAGALVLAAIVASDKQSSPTGDRVQRSFGRPMILAAALLVLGAGAAGAKLFLGGPAPAPVKRDMGAVDQGMPTDLRFNPDVQNARLVAQSDGAQLFAADATNGGYCAEIVTPDSRPAGAVCTPASEAGNLQIGVTVPFVDPVTIHSPMVVGGRIEVYGANSLEAVFSDGSRQGVALGEHRYFVFVVADEHLADAHRHGLTLVALGAGNVQVATGSVPATDFTNPESRDAMQPIFVSTISTHTDFTKVLGIEGSVNIDGAVSLMLRYPDGTVVNVHLTPNGHYHFDLPVSRQGDLFEQPGWLVASDADGRLLATRPVAAVAYWRSVG